MKFNKKIFFVALLFLFGCADDSLKPILTFEDSGKGAVIQLISESSKLINVLNESTVNSSSYTYSVKFKDVNDGKNVTEYKLDLVYDAVSGNDKTVSSFRSYGPSDFTTAEDGLVAMTGITITGTEILSSLGLSFADLAAGDQFTFKGYITLEDGQVFGYDNSSAPVRGAAFAGHFDFTLPAACPSDLTGTFSYESSTFWCGGSGTGTVDVIALGGGVYRFSDWSFGGYAGCYGGGSANSTTLTFTDVCANVKFSGFTDVYGDTWTFNSSISGNEWKIDWSNTYGETGSTTIFYSGGDWPIALQ